MNHALTCFLDQYEYGNFKNEVEKRKEAFGKNKMVVRVNSVAHIVFHELSSVLGVFEIFSFIIMSIEYR